MKKWVFEDIHHTTIRDLIIPADKVAHVQLGNPLEHALLVLIKTGYSAVPVLDPTFRLHGLISKRMILDESLGIERIEFDQLADHQVDEVMWREIPSISEDEDFLQALKLTIEHTFLCIVDEQGYFTGILPRSAILKYLNHYLRQLGSEAVV